jgi:DNA-binding MarR family transcriptional regulator
LHSAGIVRQGRELTAERLFQVRLDFRVHDCPFGRIADILASANTLPTRWLRVQIDSKSEVTALLDRLVAEALPNRSGLEAWASLLRAHATLMRRLEADLAEATGLALADFDVLAQLAQAGGELRMAELADRALISRSGMTRRVTRLVDEGLVRRANTDSDRRGVLVALTDAGVTRLAETAPVHLRAVSEMFVAQLDEQELAVLKSALDKVIVDCTFG